MFWKPILFGLYVAAAACLCGLKITDWQWWAFVITTIVVSGVLH
jgi:hypothetical protein